MESYHSSSMPSSSGYTDSPVRKSANPYAYEVLPPVGRLLDLITDQCSVGGSMRPGNRQIADWLGYASASPIPALLSELACQGWIDYDPATGVILLLCDYRSDRSLRSIADESDAIESIDRDLALPDTEYQSDRIDRSIPQCMEDHVLVAATETLDSAAARYKLPCAAKTIEPPDHRAALLSELGAAPRVIAKALAARPDLTPEQIRASWSHFEPRIKAGLCSAGAFFAAIAAGQLHAPPPDPHRPIAPEAYAGDPAFALDSAPAAPPGPSIRDRALALLPGTWTGENHAAMVRDSMFLQGRLAAGDTDADALAALDAYRKAVRR